MYMWSWRDHTGSGSSFSGFVLDRVEGRQPAIRRGLYPSGWTVRGVISYLEGGPTGEAIWHVREEHSVRRGVTTWRGMYPSGARTTGIIVTMAHPPTAAHGLTIRAAPTVLIGVVRGTTTTPSRGAPIATATIRRIVPTSTDSVVPELLEPLFPWFLALGLRANFLYTFEIIVRYDNRCGEAAQCTETTPSSPL